MKKSHHLEKPPPRLMAALVSGSAETREATASLRRSAEQQERLYQRLADAHILQNTSILIYVILLYNVIHI